MKRAMIQGPAVYWLLALGGGALIAAGIPETGFLLIGVLVGINLAA